MRDLQRYPIKQSERIRAEEIIRRSEAGENCPSPETLDIARWILRQP